MEDKIFVIERFLNTMLEEILDLQVVVGSLYSVNCHEQNDMFLLYHGILEEKIARYTALRTLLRAAANMPA